MSGDTKLERLSEGSQPVVLMGPAAELQPIEAVLLQLPDLQLWRFSGREPSPEQVHRFAEQLEHSVEQEGLKRMTLVGHSWGAPLAIEYSSSYPRNVRRIVLVDGRARLHQTTLEKVIEKLEEYLPLGLPLRPLSKAFDPRPILHRVRCPSLILHSPEQSADGVFLAARIPNAWREPLSVERLSERLSRFLEVATKQPQKNLSRAG